jgi:hypothetical protein
LRAEYRQKMIEKFGSESAYEKHLSDEREAARKRAEKERQEAKAALPKGAENVK